MKKSLIIPIINILCIVGIISILGIFILNKPINKENINTTQNKIPSTSQNKKIELYYNNLKKDIDENETCIAIPSTIGETNIKEFEIKNIKLNDNYYNYKYNKIDYDVRMYLNDKTILTSEERADEGDVLNVCVYDNYLMITYGVYDTQNTTYVFNSEGLIEHEFYGEYIYDNDKLMIRGIEDVTDTLFYVTSEITLSTGREEYIDSVEITCENIEEIKNYFEYDIIDETKYENC